MTDGARSRQYFDENWFFHKGDLFIPYAVKGGMTGGLTDCGNREEGEWLDIAYVDKEAQQMQEGWEPVQLPHDWCPEGQFINDPNMGSRAGSHGFLYAGIGFYRKKFTIPAGQLGKKIEIGFDGVTGRSTVWVNGHLIGERFGGYTSFTYDITDVLRYGEEGDNIVLVKVDATDHEGWWYEGSGIYRHVWLQATDLLHIAPYGTYVTTTIGQEGTAVVSLETKVMNEGEGKRVFTCHTLISERAGGRKVAEQSSHAALIGLEEITIGLTLKMDAPELWSPEHPFLYIATTELYEEDKLVDRVETRFGVRTIVFDKEQGFLLNGNHYPIKGTSNHQDFAGVGVAMPKALIAYKLTLLKEMGCNAYRSAHHPPSPELLDLCDELGMLVMDENRKLDSSARGMDELKAMILRDRNHPSVILWSLENEEVLEGTVMGARILRSLSQLAHKLDPTRPTMAAMNHGWSSGGYAEAIDIVGYNYGHRGADVDGRRKNPDRLILGSESASYTTTRGIYEDDPVKGYCTEYGTNIPSWGCSPEKSWTDVLRHPYLTGIFVWTGFDYRGEPTPYEWPCISSHYGMMDTCGFPKDVYYLMKALWVDEPIVHLLPHWNWPEREGEQVKVAAYTNCDSVELFLNGRSLGERMVKPHYSMEWAVAYEPGELTAVGKIGGAAAAESKRRTAGKPHAIRLEANRIALSGDGADVAAVRVTILDMSGNVVPYADSLVHFQVEGAGKLLGVGNGNPSSHESDKASSRRAFNGHALALVQAGLGHGSITLKATAAGLHSSEVVIGVSAV
ncbi:beta-galactosidase [Paenibacillus endophyticus]|uniref:Beta-galactosidase n=1 Tax=Paenibacillus endophyticus TaxID=1294268 RepID=A0A7W5G9K1_9BACL|nr:beta-galactosidase GalA [Paenibacillus endophyticus]MBB3151403.1 beta-galactosidase [Paenibacillus endophyticus]